MKQQRAAEQMQEEQIAYGRLKVLAGDFIAVYVVSPETGRYREFSATSDYDNLEQAKRGRDFFKASRDAAPAVLHPEDLNRFVSVLTKENMLAEIEKYGIFTLSYRVMMEGRPRYVQLKAALVEEKEGKRLIVGINDIDAQVRQEEEYVRHIAKARIMANIDPLTSVKNRHAYLEAEERLNEQIAERPDVEFAIVLLDVNDLKKVNDTAGHQAGDQYIKDACKIICDTFKHSPVFRIGGDEFAVIVQGSDYACIDDLVEKVNEQNEDALKNGGIVIACGMAKYENDEIAAPVLERADRNMYENKSILKSKP
jgi:diguanylate cyclase (GGDEF)-like protein